MDGHVASTADLRFGSIPAPMRFQPRVLSPADTMHLPDCRSSGHSAPAPPPPSGAAPPSPGKATAHQPRRPALTMTPRRCAHLAASSAASTPPTTDGLMTKAARPEARSSGRPRAPDPAPAPPPPRSSCCCVPLGALGARGWVVGFGGCGKTHTLQGAMVELRCLCVRRTAARGAAAAAWKSFVWFEGCLTRTDGDRWRWQE